jgi:hypothetical protein
MSENYQSKDLQSLVLDYYDPTKREDYFALVKVMTDRFSQAEVAQALRNFEELRQMLGIQNTAKVKRDGKIITGADLQLKSKPTPKP